MTEVPGTGAGFWEWEQIVAGFAKDSGGEEGIQYGEDIPGAGNGLHKGRRGRGQPGRALASGA